MKINEEGERVYADAAKIIYDHLVVLDPKDFKDRHPSDDRIGAGTFFVEIDGARFEVEITNITERTIRHEEYREGQARKEAANRRAMSIQGRVFSLLDKAGIGKQTQDYWGRGFGDAKPYYRLDRIAKEDGTAKCVLDFFCGRKGEKATEGSDKELRKQAKTILEADGYRTEIVNKVEAWGRTKRDVCQLHVYPKET